MSGISAVNGNTNSYELLLLALQNGSQQNNTPTTGSQAPTSSSATSAPTANPLATLENQLVSAITTALQNAEQTGSTGSASNLQSVIQNAIQQTLQSDGLDPETTQQASSSQTHHHHHHHGGGSVGQAGGSSDSQQATGASGAPTISASTANPTDVQSTSGQETADMLLQVLSSWGSTNQSVNGFLLNVQS